jgi:hypothetical protein
MLSNHALVFDDYIMLNGTTVDVYTPPRFNEMLAQEDQIGLQVVVEEASGGSLAVQIETSVDGIHWIPKQATAEIPSRLLSIPGPTVFPYGGDGGTLPTLSLARLRLTLSAATSGLYKAKVKVGATLRDRGQGGGFTGTIMKQIKVKPKI